MKLRCLKPPNIPEPCLFHSGGPRFLRLLLQSLWLDIWKANGISVQSLGNHETAAKLFTEAAGIRTAPMHVTDCHVVALHTLYNIGILQSLIVSDYKHKTNQGDMKVLNVHLCNILQGVSYRMSCCRDRFHRLSVGGATDQVEQLHSEDVAQVQERYKALDLPVGQLDDHKWVMHLDHP